MPSSGGIFPVGGSAAGSSGFSTFGAGTSTTSTAFGAQENNVSAGAIPNQVANFIFTIRTGSNKAGCPPPRKGEYAHSTSSKQPLPTHPPEFNLQIARPNLVMASVSPTTPKGEYAYSTSS
jgi:hypothetical protein